MGSRGIQPRCPVWNRALYSPELATSKMGYEAKEISNIGVLRGGCGPSWSLAQPPGSRRTSDQFHTLRNTLLSPDNKTFFGFFELLVFQIWSRDPRRHGNVGNRLADRMGVLSKPSGACFRSKSPSEEPKFRFSPSRHLFSEFGGNGRGERSFLLSGESNVFLGVWNWSEVLSGPGGCASLHKGPGPPRRTPMLPIVLASYPIFDLASFVP